MFDTKNMPYFLFGYTVLIVILLVFVIVREYLFEKSFAHGKVKVISRIEIDAITGLEIVVLSIVNKSFNNVEIRGFGFKHFNQDYDYMRNYRLEKGIKEDDKLFIAARDTLEVRINLDGLKTKLNSSKIRKFRSYAVDVYGNYVISKAKYVEKYIELFFQRVEFVAKVGAMPKEKQQKYYAKQNNLDERVNKILNKSIETKLKFVEEAIPVEEQVNDVKEETIEETVVEEVNVVEPVEEVKEESIENEETKENE